MKRFSFAILVFFSCSRQQLAPPGPADAQAAPTDAAINTELGAGLNLPEASDNASEFGAGDAAGEAGEKHDELGFYATMFDPVDGRVTNIRTAAAALDGAVIAPGAVFSFNDAVGIRTAKRGYVNAPVLLQGRRTDDLGGGVCQVSSTLHAAAIHAGLTVVERRPHSLVSKYIDPGFDATVAFPASCEVKDAPCEKLDLKLRNPFDQAVTIHAVVTAEVYDSDEKRVRGHLGVYVTGDAPRYRVEVTRQTEPMGRGGRRWVRSGKILTPGYVKVVQQAGEGYFVRLTARYYDHETLVREFKWFSRYPPVDEVWEVGYARPADAGAPWEKPQ